MYLYNSTNFLKTKNKFIKCQKKKKKKGETRKHFVKNMKCFKATLPAET